MELVNGKQTKILCVCTHNYFRSQIMEWLLRARGYENVRSAGTNSAYIGWPRHPLVIQAINLAGGNCTRYQAKQITRDDVEWADLMLLAENSNAKVVVDFVMASGKYATHTRDDGILIQMPNSPVYILDIPDSGVDNREAVELATEKIVEWFDKWKL